MCEKMSDESDDETYVPYGERPEWDDVTPVTQPESANPGEGRRSEEKEKSEHTQRKKI